ncbi:MAG: hypothetical protein KAW82_05080 [Desulfurellaceae bacterium]|jgi:uncharacterized C2H2 Zn-finger protein|nr:hypothetical protein [Desulfurellaceae bacterium]
MEWKPLGFSDLEVGGRAASIRSLRLADEMGYLRRYRVSTVEGFFGEKFTKIPACGRLVKDKDGKIGVIITGAHSGFFKIGRSKQGQPHLLVSFSALSKKVKKDLLKQINYELFEEGNAILAREK